MAQSWLFADVGLVHLKLEATYGTNPGITPGTDLALYVRNMAVKPVIDFIERQRYGHTHRSPGQLSGFRRCELEFEVPFPEWTETAEPITATTYPVFHPLLRASGLNLWDATNTDNTEADLGGTPAQDDSVMYKPFTFGSTGATPSGQGSVSVECLKFKDGADITGGTDSGMEVWEANGAVFNLDLTLSANEECVLKFTGQGLYNTPVEYTTDISGADFASPDDGLVVQGGTVSINGNADIVSSLSFSTNWEIKERPSMGSATGLAGFMLSRMGNASGSYEVEAAEENPTTGGRSRWAEVEADTTFTLFMAGSTNNGGIYFRFEVPNAQHLSPDPTMDGVLKYSQPFIARDNSDAGDDYFGLAFSVIDLAAISLF